MDAQAQLLAEVVTQSGQRAGAEHGAHVATVATEGSVEAAFGA